MLQEKEIKEILQNTKRKIQLLRAQNDVIEKRVIAQEQMNFQGEGSQPFMYSVLGEDGEKGILVQQGSGATVGNDNGLRFRGTVNVQEDAPFVWTHLGVTRRTVFDIDPATQTIPQQQSLGLSSVFRSVDGVNVGFSENPTFHIGFTELGSGRKLFQSEEVQADGTRVSNNLLPTNLFDLKRNESLGGEAPQHGPQSFWSLPQEVVLPVSTALDVELLSSIVFAEGNANSNERFRVYVTLLGYKITTR